MNATTTSPNPFVTKEGVLVEVGQIWRDLDKRMSGRTVKVVRLGNMSFEGSVRIRNAASEHGTERWLAVRRMHRGSTGWMLVTPEIQRLTQLLRIDGLQIYTCVALALEAIRSGKPYADVIAILRVDADKLRGHSADLYAIIG